MKEDYKENLIIFLVGSVFIGWIALLIAPYLDKGLIGIIQNFSNSINSPFNIVWCENSIRAIWICEFAYIIGIGIYYSSKKNYRRNEEHGSAKWGSAYTLNKKYFQKPSEKNKIITQNVKLGLNIRKHRRNLNVLVCGGSGSGKTRFYCKPNIMQANSSFVVLDPKCEILRDTGKLLEKEGYEIKVLDLLNPSKSHSYNPFAYLKDDNDIQKLVTNLFKSIMPKGAQSSDPFWDITAAMLLMALVLYVKHEAPEEEQNFPMVAEMLRAGALKENEENATTPLDELFNMLELEKPNHIALKYYKNYKSGATKTLMSIQATLSSKLEKFNLSEIENITSYDELELDKFGEKKMALFAVIPDTDSSMNFLISILYTQLFQQLFYAADYKYGGSLPIHVHFLMDEFANVSLPDDFEKILSTARSRNVSMSIILQNISQLKALFEKHWESIIGNCDTFLYLGGNEQSSHKYVSESLGKDTIDTNSYGKSTGHSGSYSTNYQIMGRELLTPDEVRVLNNDNAIVLIRGEKAVIDKKYDILKHPNLKYTTDGGAKPYIHGLTKHSTVNVNLKAREVDNSTKEKESIKTNYIILSELEIENYLDEEKKKNEKFNKK